MGTASDAGIRISVALPPSRRIVEYAKVAEGLGFNRVWAYDSPALYTDVWVALARVAEGTNRIGVGTGVAVPTLRHPLVTASAIATIEELAPGRLVVAFGTGFTARMAMGQRAMRWAELARYFRQVRDLLSGETTEVDGAATQMIHPAGWAPARPITTALWVAPTGPKGFATAKQIDADGVMLVGIPPGGSQFPDSALLVHGTVLRPGEDHRSHRVIAAAGPWFASTFHATWEYHPTALDAMPGGREWQDALSNVGRPDQELHLAVHEGHITVLTERDSAAIAAAGDAVLTSGWTGPPESVKARAAEVAAAGIQEIVFAPTGADIAGELEAFIAAARS
jgi:5,10-methylenetetrahydromethanopterin reductase